MIVGAVLTLKAQDRCRTLPAQHNDPHCRAPRKSRRADRIPPEGFWAMYFVAFVLAIAAGAFYVAGTDGMWADPLCRYGSAFCQHPAWLAAAAMLARVWAKFVSI
jgi:hypothetical protein